MVEIQELTGDDANEEAVKPAATAAKKGPGKKKVKVEKKTFPPIAHMLAHGSPESQGRPKTFWDVWGYPIFIGVCFGISLLIFHHAPHSKSRRHRQGKMSLDDRLPLHQKYEKMIPIPPIIAQTVEVQPEPDNVVSAETEENPEPETPSVENVEVQSENTNVEAETPAGDPMEVQAETIYAVNSEAGDNQEPASPAVENVDVQSESENVVNSETVEPVDPSEENAHDGEL